MTAELITKYGREIIFLIPLGVIGIWRWSVWLIRKIVSLFYKMPKGKYSATLSVVTPVYNEDPELFTRSLISWAENGVDEIVAVIDYTDVANIEVFREFMQIFPDAKLIVTPKPGKRPALADGVRASTGEIVALVDCDTVWSLNIKNALLGPFADSRVGGLVTRQDVFETNTLSRKLFKILLDDRYLLEYPFLATSGDALLCLSGRTAVYRRVAIEYRLDELVNETFWGQPMISGDDKTLTRLVQADGWKTRYLRDVRVFTSGTPSLSDFLKQKVRWTRNGLRSDSKVLFSRWIWRHHKILALHMLDKLVSPLTLLLGLTFFVVSLWLHLWHVVLVIAIWWVVSRTIKIFPHLREKPGDFFILPIYILMSFVMALIKVYAFFTISTQGWITRWDKSRLAPFNFFRKLPAYIATSAVMAGSFFLVLNYKSEALQASKMATAQKQTNGVSLTISQEPRQISEAVLAQRRNTILKNKTSNAYGLYTITRGDTLLMLQRKFNIGSVAWITYENNIPITNPNSIAVGSKVMIPVDKLRNPLNADQLLKLTNWRPSVILFDKVSNTIYVRGGGNVVTLSKIRQALAGNKTLLEEQKPGEWILRANLYIGKNVTLVLDKREVSYLKLKSDESGFIWIRTQGGDMLISNTKVTSWDESRGVPDVIDKDGRSYIVAKSSGRLDVVNSEIAYLGYVGELPKRGGAFGGSYGLSWKITSGRFKSDLLTGSVINSSIHNNYFGIYTFGATGLIIKNNQSFDNVQYGIDPHDDSNNFIISNNRVFNNGNHGIILSKRCLYNEISNNVSYSNRLHGIMLDRDSNNNVIFGNKTYGNVDGIALYASNNNLIYQNDVSSNKQGVRLNSQSSGNYFDNNQIYSATAAGVHVYGGSNGNFFISNNVHDNALGLSLKDTSNNVFYDDLKAGANKKDGFIGVNANSNEIK